MKKTVVFKPWIALCLLLAAGCGRSTPDELLADARAAYADGEARTAQIHLKNLLREAPDNVDARTLLGQVSLSLGDMIGAESEFRRALQLGADPTPLQIPLLQAMLGQEEYAEMLEQIESGPALSGEDRISKLRLTGAAYRGLGQPAEAEAAYREALAADPGSILARTDLASLLIEQGRIDDAQTLVTAVLTEQPDVVPALLLRGRIESLAGRFADAETSYRRAIELAGSSSANHFSALSQLTDTLLAEHKLDEAETTANELLSRYPNQPISQFLRAQLDYDRGDLDAAQTRLEDLIAKLPNYAPANRLLGSISARTNKPGQARMYLQAAVTDDPKDNRARLKLAELYLQSGDTDRAKALLAESLPGIDNDGLMYALAGAASLKAGELDAANAYFEQSRQSQPDSLKSLADLSSIYIAAGEFDRAIDLVEKTTLDNDDSAAAKAYLLALIHIRQNDLDGARAAADQLSELVPDAAWPLNLEGSIAVVGKDFEAARKAYTSALDVEPDYIPALLNLVRVDLVQNDQDAAKAALLRVIDVDAQQPQAVLALAALALNDKDYAAADDWLGKAPESAVTSLLRGQVLAAQQRFADAANAFMKSYDQQPSAQAAVAAFDAGQRASLPNPEARVLDWSARNPRDVQANLILGAVAIQRNQRPAAVRRFEAVIDVQADQVVALNNLAWFYGESGDKRALSMAERAYSLASDNPAIADTLGWLRMQNGDAAGALPLLEKSSKALPDNAEIGYHYAVALAETGDRQRAAGLLRDLLAGGGDFPGRDDAEQRLEALSGR